MRETWKFLDARVSERVWVEWTVIAIILLTGFFSGLLIWNHMTPDELPPCGVGQPTDHCVPQRHPENERWDQGYFTKFGTACPAVYDAPNGELRECL